MNIPFQVICINDSHRPAEFPASKWIKKGETYNVTKIGNLKIQGGQGFQLAEIDMTGCEPYLYFSASRFGVPVDPEEQKEVEELELTV